METTTYEEIDDKNCKYCSSPVEDIIAEGMRCKDCMFYVHTTCLKRGSVPGGLTGDIFFTYTCQECAGVAEIFVREKMPWLQAILLILFHIQTKNPGLARRSYFHWKIHIATFIDKYWDVVFPKDFKKKKKWIGTISGTLSHYSPHYFHSGTTIFGDQGWWTLTYPKLTPNVIIAIICLMLYIMYTLELILLDSEFSIRKQKNREILADVEIVKEIIISKQYHEDFLIPTYEIEFNDVEEYVKPPENDIRTVNVFKRLTNKSEKQKKHLLPTLDTINESSPNKFLKTNSGGFKARDCSIAGSTTSSEDAEITMKTNENEPVKLMDPMCHYNTSLNNFSQIQGVPLRSKLIGNLREETILSPYSSLYLKPYIRRDATSLPLWLKMSAEILVKTNRHNPDYKLPPRGPIDYVYIQPSHIPAVNSLCNQFFWPGMDLTECLQYPDFSCVALYRKLIIGFAFIVPDVKVHENYISFVFVRPAWRNAGIGRFMVYHLIQTSVGKDITLHVSINNPALFLYQKFGFKVEHVVQNFYDKYYRRDARESKHAFFCRLER